MDKEDEVHIYNRILLFSLPVVSNSLQLHGLWQARPPCPPPTPKAFPGSCPLHQWCHPAIPSSDTSSPAFNLSQHQGPFQWVSCSYQVTKVLELQPVLPMNIQGWFPLRLTSLISLLSKGLWSLLQYHSLKAIEYYSAIKKVKSYYLQQHGWT